MKKPLLILGLVLITAFASATLTLYLIDTSETPSSYDVYTLDSKTLNEPREVIVKTPQGYEENKTKAYPVVFVFGGNSLTYSIAYDTDLLMRTGHMKDVIVVGVANNSQDTRQRDLTPPFMKQDLDEADAALGKADVYAGFIEDEVIPLVNRHYRTSSRRIAIGHSREGLMVLYLLTAEPSLFGGYMALSPALWREDNVFVDYFQKYLDEGAAEKRNLFLSMGDQEVQKMTSAYELFIEILKTDSTHNWASMYTKGAVHSNNAMLSAPIGIDWMLKQD